MLSLQAREYLEPDDLTKLIQPTLDGILELRFESKNVPSSVGNTSDRLVQWCHGAPGVTALYCLAYEVRQNFIKITAVPLFKSPWPLV